MKVFLAGIIQGSLQAAAIHDQDWRQEIRDRIERHCPTAQVYCHYSEHPNSIHYDHDKMVQTLTDGNRRAAAADVVVCWLPAASMGTAIEMYLAAQAGAAVLTITPMAANWVVRTYSDRVFADLDAFESFLAAGELDGLLRAKRETSAKHHGG